MNKNSLAKNINHIANICRTITTNWPLDLQIGELYDNRGQTESWQDETSQYSFMPEQNGEYTYVFYCDNVPCHKIDYNNKTICDLLDAYREEGEVLVPANTKMKIVGVSTEEDFKMMGYYQIDLELV